MKSVRMRMLLSKMFVFELLKAIVYIKSKIMK